MTFYLSPSIYNNSWIDSPSLFFLQSFPYLDSISGVDFSYPRFTYNHFNLNNLFQNPINIYWSKQDDTLVDRFHISIYDTRISISQPPSVKVSLKCKDDFTQTYTHTNPGSESITLPSNFFEVSDTSIYKPYFNITIDSNSVSILFHKIEQSNNPIRLFYFYHVGYNEPNTQFQYYSYPTVNTCYLIASRFLEGGSMDNVSFIRHYCNRTSKYVYNGLEANYPIICQHSQKPLNKWLTDFVLYDNNPSLNFPYIGISKDLICSVGEFPLGRPVFLSIRNQFYLPVFKFLNKTVMFKVYVPTK